MIRAPNLTVAVFLALAPPASAAKIVLIVGDAEQARAARARAGPDVSVQAFDLMRAGDPIEKGRLLASVQAADRVVAAARGKACGWLAQEVDGPPIHCILPYDAGQVLDFARAVGWRRVAAVHMTGYEKVYARLRAHARARDIELVAVRVDRIKELPEALPRALKNVHAVWILGDPLLTEGAAFEYLVNTSLSKMIPLIGPGSDIVARGAFLGADSDLAAMIRHAVVVANAAAKGAAPEDGAEEVPGGRLVVNQVLARRWGVNVPGGAR